MKVCPVCGYPNPDDAVYCARCGYRFPTTSQQPTQQPQPTYPQPGYYQQPPYTPQPGAPSSYGLSQDEIIGLRKIKNFGLFNIVALILIIIGMIFLYPAIFAAFGLMSPTGTAPAGLSSGTSFAVGIGGLLASLGIIIAGGILALISFFYLMSGYSSLKRVDSDFNLPYYGLWLILIADIIGIIGAIALFASAFGTGNIGFLFSIVGLYVLVTILGFIGYILGYIVGSFRLSSRYNEGDFKIAGIMYIVGIFIEIFIIIGIIFTYLGAKRVLERTKIS